MLCARCVRVWSERGGEQEEEDLDPPHSAIVVSPRAPAELPPSPPAGARVAFAIELFGPNRAFSNVARTLARAHQLWRDCSITPPPPMYEARLEHSMCACFKEGVRNVAAHCSKITSFPARRAQAQPGAAHNVVVIVEPF